MDTLNENTAEYLSKDILNDDFVDIFMSVYRLQFVLGSCRVHTKNRFVTSPTLLQKCYTVLCIILTSVSTYAVIPFYFDSMPDGSVTSLGTSILSCIYAASFFNVVHVRFNNGRQNAEFHVMIQKLDRLMKIDKRKEINTILKRTNGVSVVLILLAFLSTVVGALVNREFKALVFVGIGICLLSFILELIVCSSIVVYFFIRVRFVNFLIESYLQLEENNRNPTILSGASEKCIRFVAKDTNNDFATSEVHIYLRDILSCFAMFQDLYRFQLLLFCIKLVAISLLSFEIVLYTTSKNIYGFSQVSALIIFMIIDSFIAVFLAFRFGIFFSEVKETKRLCISVMALHQEGSLRDKAKTMLNMIEETPPRFSVYDMWDMNAGMFVTMFSLVTSLIVTLIQLAFL